MHVIADYIDQHTDWDDRQKAMLNYYLCCIVYEGSKLLLFLLFFLCIGKLKGFLYSLLIMLPLRTISGGLHFKHYLSCLGFSFGYLYIVNVVLMPIQLPFSAAMALLCLCAVINFAIGPVTSDSRPALPPQEIKRSQLKVFAATCYDTLLTALLYSTDLAAIGFWTIVLHTLQLIIAKLRKKRGEKDVQEMG